MKAIQFLMANRATIRRNVVNRPDGVETLTESDDPKVTAVLVEHVDAMARRVQEQRPIHVRDPLFAELFRNAATLDMRSELGTKQPSLVEQASKPSGELPAIARPQISAVMVRVAPGASVEQVVATISGWSDVSVHTRSEQAEFLLKGSVDKARRQLGLFRVLLTLIAAIIMALILYTLTLEKIHSIALLQLIGARKPVILGLILQQALLLGFGGYAIAWLLGQQLFPLFPRRVIVTGDDLWQLAGIVLVISVASSILGIAKALNVRPNEALG